MFLLYLETLEGEAVPGELEPVRVDAAADGERVELDGRRLERRTLPLPAPPLGCRRLVVSGARDAGEATAHLVVAPRTCHGATASGEADTDARVWGLALQLYAVRSARNWGIGDFTDLARAVEASGELGGDVVGVNPLHALFAHDPESVSPYSPSSRLFLNPLCIDVESVDGWDEASAALDDGAASARGEGDLATRLDALRAGEVIDYSAASRLEHAAFDALWDVFVARELGRDTTAARAFAAFRASEGEPLDARGEIAGDWRQWPEELRAPESPAVVAFAAEHVGRVDFHAWLQWLAAVQLDAVAARAERAEFAVGLYRDLAVGISAGGGDAWGDQALFAGGIHVGAPPDDFSANGQGRGLPPLDPRALAEAGYAPFAAILRANMHAAGAIRIDHVMGLARLFWIPAGESPAAGAYVGYPLEDMLAVVALESRRAGRIFVGEDLGTVPEGFREARAAAGVLSYRLMYFEKHYDGDQGFRARTRSRLLLANVEDLLGQVEQMNLPGSDRDVYPNWRRKLPVALEGWLAHAPLLDAARTMSEERETTAS